MIVNGEGGVDARPPGRTTALLLNLTGLGIGYAYLGYRVRAVLASAGAAVLIAIAFATDAADRPWLWRGIALFWIAAMFVDTWRSSRPARPGGSRRPLMVAVVLLLVVVAGLAGYAVAGRSTLAAALAAQGRGDCGAAVPLFRALAGPYELTLLPDVPTARSGLVECAGFEAAVRAQDDGALPEAVTRYRDLRTQHPTTALLPALEDRLADSYAGWATSLRASGDHAQAVDVYRQQLAESPADAVVARVRETLAATYVELADATRTRLQPDGNLVGQVRTAVEALLTVRDEFADTVAAPRVPQGIVDVVTAAVATAPGDPCAAVTVLDYAVRLPAEGTGGVVELASAERPQRRLDCGVARFAGEEGRGPTVAGGTAQAEFERLLADHPDSPQAAQARSGVIAAKLAAEHATPIPLPGPYVGDDTGNNSVTLYNDSPVEVRVLVSGPTAHEFTLPPCPTCPATYTTPEDACPTFDGRPSYTLRLTPGTYYELVSAPADPSIDARSDSTVVDQGYDYTICLHVEERPPYTPPSLPPPLGPGDILERYPDLLAPRNLPTLVPLEPPG